MFFLLTDVDAGLKVFLREELPNMPPARTLWDNAHNMFLVGTVVGYHGWVKLIHY